ncbi:GNAT family N-acetyltransferase [Cedecea davisae]|uniref:GNAT family N-acetyltransferase n=1 Tax=Cedecea davisae TaxID=158484 RepID=A0ABS6DHG8_9ENTR|nr:GNAT family N-acetyltransferase [Cedecea davisae]MBU4682512.1 GNAT family N-acetyltransferase [Cedecea davisae]MBU4688054.1 GNAT family N-acetyltransferase [Cedecea davisae]
MNTQFTSITPDCQEFAELRAQSIAAGFNMLRRLDENWQSGLNRFDRPGEKLLGAYIGGLLVGVCGLNIDPFSSHVTRSGRLRHFYIDEKWRRKQVGSKLLREILKGADHWFDLINTNAPSTAFAFYTQAGFGVISDIDKVTHRLYLKIASRKL